VDENAVESSASGKLQAILGTGCLLKRKSAAFERNPHRPPLLRRALNNQHIKCRPGGSFRSAPPFARKRLDSKGHHDAPIHMGWHDSLVWPANQRELQRTRSRTHPVPSKGVKD